MNTDLTTGKITGKLLIFALPFMVGNVLQQFYNIVDTWVVGQYISSQALAAVGSSYTLMTFLTSILLGLCMGSGAFFAVQTGRREDKRLRQGVHLSFWLIGAVSLVMTGIVFLLLNWIIAAMQIPEELQDMIRAYLRIIFLGIPATFLYNYYCSLMRAIGNSVLPLCFLGISVVSNIVLDLVFVLVLQAGVEGAAWATVISQYFSGLGLYGYYRICLKQLHPSKEDRHWDFGILREIWHLSGLTCLQQSTMNLGILMVQGLVNSFGAVTMAAFSVAVKIDTIAYMPVQDYGNAFSTFVAQNYGAGKNERIRKGIRTSVMVAAGFSLVVSAVVFVFAPQLMGLFVQETEQQVIQTGVGYLRIEGAFYVGIGILFLLYGYYRAVGKPGMSLILTICSLGTRVVLAYALSSIEAVGVTGIWAAIPIGWFLADLVGILYYCHCNQKKE